MVLLSNARRSRQWEHDLVPQLRALGWTVGIRPVAAAAGADRLLDAVLKAEARKLGRGLASAAPPLAAVDAGPADLVIDLTGESRREADRPVLTLSIAGADGTEAGLRRLRTLGALPEVVARLDGVAVGIARPMLSDRVWLSRDCTEVLASVQALIAQCLRRFEAGTLSAIAAPQMAEPSSAFAAAYGARLFKGLASRVRRKLTPGARPFSWQTGYRLIDGPGVAERGVLDGPPFHRLADDGQRFYADPFPVVHEGRSYIFVEEFPYALGRGIISVAEVMADGTITVPRPVLEEPHHLSYPNVFERGGEMFMIPESGGADALILYRAEVFPDRWVRDRILIEGRSLNDATLFEQDGRLWMFGTQRFGRGSASDTMMVYSAPDIRGPWTEHRLNPIVIDRAGARPGGNVVWLEGRPFLPVQDGTRTYGGGLGLRELISIDDADIVLGPVRAVRPGSAWHLPGIHTLNRAGRLEVVDGTP